MNIGSSIGAKREALELVQPSERTFDDPSITSESLRRVDAATSDACDDLTNAAIRSAENEVVAFVGVNLLGTRARSAERPSDSRHGFQQRDEEIAVVNVRGAERDGEWNALGVYDDVVLRARLSAVRRVRARLLAPPFARTLEASSAARDQSIASALPSSSSNTLCRRCHTPASCQSRSRRQHVMPHPQPISCGRCSQPIPVLSTKMIPVSVARSSRGGRPPCGFARSGGSNGCTRSHSSSETRGLAMGTFHYP